jgi:hypothetical protein
MTETTDQTSARPAGQIAWQRQATALPGKLRELTAKEKLPPVNWTVLNAGATLDGECIAYSWQPPRREYVTAWRDAISAARGMAPGIDNEAARPDGEVRFAAPREWVSVALTAGRRSDSSAHVTLTARIWPNHDGEG